MSSTTNWGSRGRHAAPDPEWPDDEAWHDRMGRIGEAAAVHLDALLDEFTAPVVAMVCTADGFNLCSVGLEADGVEQYAALSGLLHSVSRASLDAMPHVGANPDLEVVSVQAHDLHMLCVSFDHPDLSTLILAAASRQTTLGELLLQSKITAGKLHQALAPL